MSQTELTGADLLAWRQSHGIPRKVLAAAVGYLAPNSITMVELYRSHVPQRLREHMATYTPPPRLTGAALRHWRERLGLTTEQVGLRLGVTGSGVRMWELGYRKMPWRVRLYVAAHPAPLGPLRVIREPGTREEVFAAVQAGAHTSAAVQATLPYRLSIARIRAHLRALGAAGQLVGRQAGYQPKVWQVTP